MGQIDGAIDSLEKSKRDQILKLITKGFYNELINYGVEGHEVVTISTHLLDELLRFQQHSDEQVYNSEFFLKDVENNWESNQSLTLREVTLQPFDHSNLPDLVSWLADSRIGQSFIGLLPKTEEALRSYFQADHRYYFGIYYQRTFTGIIGGEHLDRASRKLEMRKFVGDSAMRGKGIGKRATFLFLYWCYLINNVNKVYLHTCDINIRNINLNAKMGFCLEGILMEDLILDEKKQDVVRMSLLKAQWVKLFK